MILLGVIFAVLPSTVEGTTSPYYASNCYEVGGGNMGPLYLKCAGCQYVEAFECLNTLRSNASENVPRGCGMNELTVQPDPTCCPVFEDPSSQNSVDESTSAYPDAILCLEAAGCAGVNLHTALVNECNFNQCQEEFSCVAAYAASPRVSPALRATALIFVISRIAIVAFGEYG